MRFNIILLLCCLMAVLQAHSVAYCKKDVARIFKKMDKNHNNVVTAHEAWKFYKHMVKHMFKRSAKKHCKKNRKCFQNAHKMYHKWAKKTHPKFRAKFRKIAGGNSASKAKFFKIGMAKCTKH